MAVLLKMTELSVSCWNWMFLLWIFVFVALGNTTIGKCPSLEAPYLGHLTGNCSEANHGETCTVSCSFGYQVEGQENRVCNSASGRWSPNKKFSCIDRTARCHPLQPPVRGYLTSHCANHAGSECFVGCFPGYKLIGSERLVCLKSFKKWIPARPICKRITCTNPKAPRNGSKVNGKCNLELGETCEFTCNAGFYLVGTQRRKCTPDGLWSGRPVRCVRMCPRILEVSNGRPWGQCDPGVSGYSCHVTCSNGYYHNATQDYVTCGYDGQWSGSLPKCKKVSCPPIEPIENGDSLGNCEPGVFGLPCIFQCNYSYKLNGSSNSVCLADGNWSEPVPTCTKILCPPVNMTNVEIQEGVCNEAEPGDWCRVQCIPGFRISGIQNITCLISGDWSGRTPNCKKRNSCRQPKVPKHGSLGDCNNDIGGKCHQMCDADYVAEGPDYRNCLESGLWDGIVRRCIRKDKFSQIPQ